jgi:translocation and assembly module TamB
LKIFSTKIRYMLIILVLIPVIGTIAGSVYLDSAAFRNMVLEKVNAVLDGRVIIGGHRLSLVSGKLALTGVRLERADGQPLARMERLEVRVILWDLLHRRIHVSILDLDKVRVLLAFDDQDRLQMVGPAAGEPTPPESGEVSAPWQVIVDDFRLKEGELVFQRPARGWSGRAEKIQLAGDLDLGRRQGRLNFSAGPLVWQDGAAAKTLPTLTAEALWTGNQPSTFTLKTAQSSLKAKGRLIPDGASPELDVIADLNLDLGEVRPWIPADIRLEGRAAGHIVARGPVDDPSVDLHLTLPQGNLAGIAVAPLKADLTYGQGRVSVSALEAADGWGTLKAAGVVDLSGGRIENSSATLTAASLAALGQALGVELPAGSGTVKLSCAGPWARPTGRLEVLAQNIVYRQFRFGRLLAAADLDASGVVTFSNLVLQNQGGLVEGRGRLILQQTDGQWRSDPGLDVALDVQNLNSADFGVDLPAQGLINGSLKVGGSIQHLQGQAVLAQSSLRWNELVFDLGGSALWDDGRLSVSALRLSRQAAMLEVQGSLLLRDGRSGQWLDAPAIQAEAHSQGLQLQDFFKDYSGALTLAARVKGSPADLSGNFELTGSDLELAGQPLAAALIKGRLAKQTVYLETVDVMVADDQKIQGRGWYALDQRFEMALEAAGIGLENIPALQRAYPVDGLLVLSLKGQGTLQKPLVTAEMTVRQPRLNNQPWDDFHLTARLQERALDLDADLNFTLKAHGRLDSGDFDVTARLQDADLSPYLAMAGGADWGGRLSGRLQAGGNWHRLQNIRAELDIAEARLRYQSQDLLNTRGLTARLQDGMLDLPASRLEVLQNGFLSLAASGDLRKDLRLTADGRLPLTALAPFSDLLAGARGALNFQVRVDGPLDDLQWQADVNLADIGWEVPGLGQEIQGLSGRVAVNPRELKVEQVTGRLDSGRFSLAGQVALEDLRPSGGKLVFQARSLPLQWPNTLDAVVNADLALESADNKSTLSGKVVLLEGTYYKDVRINLLSAVSQPRRAESVPTGYDLPPWLADMVLNVSLTHRYPLLVDNNLARLQVAPDLKLIGTPQRPVISGRAQVTEGEVIFRRKSFTVKRGVVDFINPYKIEPSLDIAAESQIRQWLVTLNLSGTPDRLAFALSSTPPESESDILSLILLGRTSSELAGGQGGGGQTTRQMLATLVATAWGEDVKKTTGVDILEVETGTGAADTSADTIQLTVGKRLSRRLTIKYEVQSGSEELVQRAVSEYRFLEHLLASGFQDSLGGYGGELLFRIEF